MDLGKGEAVKRFPALHCWSQASRFHFRSPCALSVGTHTGQRSSCLQHTQLRAGHWMPLNPLNLSEEIIWSSSTLNPVTTREIEGPGSDCWSGVPFLTSPKDMMGSSSSPWPAAFPENHPAPISRAVLPCLLKAVTMQPAYLVGAFVPQQDSVKTYWWIASVLVLGTPIIKQRIYFILQMVRKGSKGHLWFMT